MSIDWDSEFIYKDGDLYNKVNRGGPAKAGLLAGNVNGNGYRQVRYQGRHHMVSRIIWEMHNGKIPDNLEVDHRDRNRLNNHIDNLRLVDRNLNALNRGKQSNNTSGYKGVSKQGRKFVASLKYRGKFHYLGRWDTAEEASRAYEAKYAELHVH